MKGKIAFVTGGSKGIGKAICLKLAAEGLHVAIADIDEAGGKETMQEITESGGAASFYQLDVSDKSAVESVVGQIVKTHGRLDCAVNNAGIGGELAPVHEVAESDWHRMININLSGQFYCMQAELTAMMELGAGSIVNVSSLAGVGGMAWGSPYSAAKHGLIGLTKSAALEYAKMNIRINAVCPGFTDTDILNHVSEKVLDFTKRYRIPQKRLGLPKEVADAAFYLLSDQSSYINGTYLFVDGGMSAGQ